MIIAFCGKLQSGKSSSCRYVVGEVMKKKNLIQSFKMGEDGSLIVPDVNGNFGVFDPEALFVNNLSFHYNVLWRYVKILNFADSLKEDCCKYFGISKELAYGSKKDKDTKLKIKWGDISHIFSPAKELNKEQLNSRMTVRDVLITYADMVRAINPEAFVNALFDTKSKYSSELFLIGDLRYEYEAKRVKESGGRVIRFNKVVDKNFKHSSEESDQIDSKYIDRDIDNSEISIVEKNQIIKSLLKEWGVL